MNKPIKIDLGYYMSLNWSYNIEHLIFDAGIQQLRAF